MEFPLVLSASGNRDYENRMVKTEKHLVLSGYGRNHAYWNHYSKRTEVYPSGLRSHAEWRWMGLLPGSLVLPVSGWSYFL